MSAPARSALVVGEEDHVRVVLRVALRTNLEVKKLTNPKPNRTELVIKMEYHGALTNKKYVADVVIKIDSTEKDSWEVLNIDYTDNNNVPANANKIQELIKKLNK
jgi:hypothetical protein